MTQEEPKSEQNRSSGNTVIWVAVIGLVGTLGAAIIANWNNLVPPPVDPVVVPVDKPEITQTNPRVEVEKIAGKWCAAWLSGDAGTFVSLASEPFYFDNNLVLTKSELRSEYLKLLNEKGDVWRKLKISSIKVQTAGELKEQGYDLSTDRIFQSLNLSLDDYAVTVMIELNGQREGMILVVRRLINGYEVVGTWD